MLPDTTPAAISAALAEFDRIYRNKPDWLGWEAKLSFKYALRHGSRLYPPKKIVSLVTATALSEFSGGDEANDYLRSYGFEVMPLRAPALHPVDESESPLEATGLQRKANENAPIVAGATGRAPAISAPGAVLGEEYREADEQAAVEDRDPFPMDPEIIERGVRGHASTQNRIAHHLRSIGLDPRSPRSDEPNFDIAWKNGNRLFIAEVKSITASNEEKQLRLGLGQALRYAHQMRGSEETVPVLIAERRPTDDTWSDLCSALGVVLAWPDSFPERFPREYNLATTAGL